MPVNKKVSGSPEGLGSWNGIPDLVELSGSLTNNCQALETLLKGMGGQTAHRTDTRGPSRAKGETTAQKPSLLGMRRAEWRPRCPEHQSEQSRGSQVAGAGC